MLLMSASIEATQAHVNIVHDELRGNIGKVPLPVPKRYQVLHKNHTIGLSEGLEIHSLKGGAN